MCIEQSIFPINVATVRKTHTVYRGKLLESPTAFQNNDDWFLHLAVCSVFAACEHNDKSLKNQEWDFIVDLRNNSLTKKLDK